MRPLSRFRAALRSVSVVFLLLSSLHSFAQEFHPTESQVEAAYLYNFGKFVTWPADRVARSSTFQICILGKDPFGAILDSTVSGESIGGKKISVQRLTDIQQAQPCMILFVSSSEESQLPAILATANTFSLLTVSNMAHFAERGGDIGLVRERDRVRFEVNRSSAEEDHLQLSSELLKVAVRVIRKH
jgi:hypothetical protein